MGWIATSSSKVIPSFSSVQFSHSVVSNSLRPHESQHARPPCPSPTLRVYWNSCSSSQWCHSSHYILCRPLLLLPPIPPSIGVFSNESTLCMRWPKYWSFSFSISPSNEHPGLVSFKDGLVVSPCNPRDSQESSPTPQFKNINFSALNFLHSSTLTSIHDHWKNHSLDGPLLAKQCLCFNMLSSLVITFLPRSKRLLILWLQSPSAVIL